MANCSLHRDVRYSIAAIGSVAAWPGQSFGQELIGQIAVESVSALPLLWNTCFLALGAIAISLPLGTFLAIYLERTDLRGRRIGRAMVYCLVFVPAFVQVAAWDAGFGMQGWIGYSTGYTLLAGWRAAIWLHAVTAVPWVTIIVMLGLRYTSAQIEEDALLQAGPWFAFWCVTMRAAMPAMVAAAIWVFIVAANEITITDVYQVRTFAEEVYVGFALGDGVHEAQTRVFPGALLVGILIVAAVRVCRQFTSLQNLAQARRPNPYTIRRWRRLLQSFALLLLATLVLLPLFNLCYKAGIQVDQVGDDRVRVWSAAKLVQIFATSPFRYAKEVSWSMVIGQLTAIATVGLAYVLAWWQDSGPVKFLGYSLAIIGLAVPAPILALTVARFFSDSHSPILAYLYDDTICVTWLVLTLRCFPFAYLLALHAVNSMGTQVLENATLDGLSRLGQLRSIGIRQLFPFLLATWIITFAWTISELSATILTVPPGVNTLSVTMFNLVHYGVEDRLAGISLFVGVISGVLAMLGVRLIALPHDSSRVNRESNV